MRQLGVDQRTDGRRGGFHGGYRLVANPIMMVAMSFQVTMPARAGKLGLRAPRIYVEEEIGQGTPDAKPEMTVNVL